MQLVLPIVTALLVVATAFPTLAAGPKMATVPTSATEIHGIALPDPVAAAKRDAKLREAGHRFDGRKPVACRYPALIENKQLLRWVNIYSRKNGLDPRLVYALIEQESRFNPCAVSPKGAQGIMQIMPDTQKVLGLSEPFDPERNIAAGTKYLRSMLDRFQTEVMALAAYNAGPGAVAKHGGVPPYEETKDYVLKVVDRYFYLRQRYPVEDLDSMHKKLTLTDAAPLAGRRENP
ncbi:Lytic transglycosylase catalytic [Solidesulfovibrio fructosivorans JJ]]|uniref:Lytic transglycosylase catalytic n=1 Tax=Solidesulfovibrio fructosivorans JJ] TaxID=596151 RepID=E1JZK7_SOLFR|nr:lytic transglycosylase domain-containing protein [Solidesulfovibrio fructosivorans]EFL50254.1 Lytic transglycosylase catalytic [Solidesulfovibrio fructosivorans JJ]]